MYPRIQSFTSKESPQETTCYETIRDGYGAATGGYCLAAKCCGLVAVLAALTCYSAKGLATTCGCYSIVGNVCSTATVGCYSALTIGFSAVGEAEGTGPRHNEEVLEEALLLLCP
ncbi:hypothetical protein L1987_48928 [Smallanthus sonchifolius]|uniref:Uncharacterized protein n=1 Tax=Smallanthus sonchifolius TaxID=185202 RepID=A0ACB9FTB6_9ASTR|nr:hypothetical protein L1987_48928 [Smallanthus sonchifolius]